MPPLFYLGLLSGALALLLIAALVWSDRRKRKGQRTIREQSGAYSRLTQQYIGALQTLVQVLIERYIYDFDGVIDQESEMPLAGESLLKVTIGVRNNLKQILVETHTQIRELETIGVENSADFTLKVSRILATIQTRIDQTVDYMSDEILQSTTEKLPAARRANVWRGHLQQKLRQVGMDALRVAVEAQTEGRPLPQADTFLAELELAMQAELDATVAAYRGPRGRQAP